MKQLVIGTRGSELALWQARYTCTLLKQLGIDTEIRVIHTRGDLEQGRPATFTKTGDKGVFTKELEEALLQNNIDIAVHSLKDLPYELPEGLIIGGISPRENARDVIIIKKKYFDPEAIFFIQKGCILGTSSLRRNNIVSFIRKDLTLVPLRGNVPTRIKKLIEDENLHGIILAKAGTERLQIPPDSPDFTIKELSFEHMIPAPGQGAIVWEIRKEETTIKKILEQISCPESSLCTQYERTMMNFIGTGCHSPAGIHIEKKDLRYIMHLSYSADVSVAPVWGKISSLSPDELLLKGKKIIDRKNLKILISKSPEDFPLICLSLKENGHQVHMNSFIDFVPVPCDIHRFPFEVVFFTSPRSVTFFFQHCPHPDKKILFGCLGPGTRKKLLSMGYTPVFTGKENQTSDIMKRFAALYNNKKILIPVADKHQESLRHIFCNEENHRIIPVYKTIYKTLSVPEAFYDIGVFTSPSQWISFTQNNPMVEIKNLVTIGETTAKEVVSKGYKNKVWVCDNFEELEILRTVYGVMGEE